MATTTEQAADIPREQWNTRIGYLLAMMGAAVGLGNIVRFPFVVSENGGAAFVLIYLAVVALIGIPMVLAELTLGRRSQRNVVDTFRSLGSRRWLPIGLFFVVAVVFILAWYSVVGGWTLVYLTNTIQQSYWSDPAGYFLAISEGGTALAFHALFLSISVAVVATGVADGIEPAVRVLMPLLVLILAGIAVYGLTLPGVGEGLTFYLQPDLSSVTLDTITAAVGQAFFSLGPGFGILLTYASYMDQDSSLTEDSLTVGFSDTGIALLSGFVVFPLLAAFALLGTPAAEQGGLGVAFLALPEVFSSLGPAVGVPLAVAFFFLLFAAALSSSIAVIEVGVGWLTDQGFTRRRSALLIGLVVYILGIAMALSSRWLDLAAGPISDVILIFNGLVIALFLGWFYEGYLDEDPAEEMDRGSTGLRIGRASFYLVRYVVPVVLGGLLVLGVVELAEVVGLTG